MKQIKQVAVLGAGVMGAGIAAHLANAGLKVLLLDMVPREVNESEKAKGMTLNSRAVRNRLADTGIQGVLRGHGFYQDNLVQQVTTGNFDDDITRLQNCDWVIEAVIENMAIKKNLFQEKVVANLQPGAIFSSNTSGLSINEMAEALPDHLRKNFMATHFFNPPRAMRLLELVPSQYTDPFVFKGLAEFCSRRLGKGIVFGKDTPNFIANRIGVFSMCNGIHHMAKMGLSVEDVDAVSGPATARPRSALCKLFDLVGIDTMKLVADNSYRLLPNDEDREMFRLPGFVAEMVDKGLTGRKAKQGFYRRATDGSSLSFDYTSGSYQTTQTRQIDALDAARKCATPEEKLKAVLAGDDPVARFAWCNLRDTLLYTVKLIPEIADDIVNVDNAMKWGFNWSVGPFEMLDALGVQNFVKRVKADGLAVPEVMKNLESFYTYDGTTRLARDLVAGEFREIQQKEGMINLSLLRRSGSVVEKNADASLHDLADGVFCLEFHSKMNSIEMTILEMVGRAIARAEREGIGLVIGNHGRAFSVGANLAKFAAAIEAGRIADIDVIVKAFQTNLMAMKYSAVPVVAAPFNMTLGGGCEVALHADGVNAHAETNMGLVEIGVGLIPAGGGTKEMALRAIEMAAPYQAEILPFIEKHFLNIARSRVSTSADELFDMGLMRRGDAVTMDIDNLIADAKQKVVSLAGNYRQKQPQECIVAPGRTVAVALKNRLRENKAGGLPTEYELELADHVADIMTGGDVSAGTLISEQHLLDLERQKILHLCGNSKTLARIQHMLKVGKVLRN